jgi:hypothetical protein
VLLPQKLCGYFYYLLLCITQVRVPIIFQNGAMTAWYQSKVNRKFDQSKVDRKFDLLKNLEEQHENLSL